MPNLREIALEVQTSLESSYTQAQVVEHILTGQSRHPNQEMGRAFAPANVALCKYWGKRDDHLNLPVTNSLSISLGSYGAKTVIYPIDATEDYITLNGLELKNSDPSKINSFTKRLILFLDLFRAAGCTSFKNISGKSTSTTCDNTHFRIDTETNIPVAAGLASSAAGFAALVKALNDLYGWNLDMSQLSILARLGSGSACRSLWDGFVEWEQGKMPSGLDSFGSLCNSDWQDFRIGLLIMNPNEKSLSSRVAMKANIETSEFYQCWPARVEKDLVSIKAAIANQDFELLGETAESNALCMHALMQTAQPPIVFSEALTIAAWHKVWQLRHQGLKLYFTQDAGPNLKLLFLAQDESKVLDAFPELISIAPIVGNTNFRRTVE